MRTPPPDKTGRGAVPLGGGNDAPTRPSKRTKGNVRVRCADGSTFRLSGRGARIMRALVAASAAGITPLDVWPISTRLAAIIFDFRHRYGLTVAMELESHGDGQHARYWLQSPVTLDALF